MGRPPRRLGRRFLRPIWARLARLASGFPERGAREPARASWSAASPFSLSNPFRSRNDWLERLGTAYHDRAFGKWSIDLLTAPNASDFTVSDDPFALFAQWFAEARSQEINDPEAMALATVDAERLAGRADGALQAGRRRRPRLLHQRRERQGAGARRDAEGRRALFHWKSLRRQARFRGAVAMLDEAAADAYFAPAPARQPDRRLGEPAVAAARIARSRSRSWSSTMSARFGDGEIPRPAYWRGFRLAPVEIEFWQDGAFRLHDRVVSRARGRVGGASGFSLDAASWAPSGATDSMPSPIPPSPPEPDRCC